MFKRRGVFEIENKFDFDTVMDIAITNDALDVIDNEESYTVYTEPETFLTVKDALESGGINEFVTSEITFVPDNTIPLDDEKMEKLMGLIDALEDLDDVQDVYHNAEV